MALSNIAPARVVGRARHTGAQIPWLFGLAAIAMSVGAGFAVGKGGLMSLLATALALGSLGTVAGWAILRRVVASGAIAVEIPIVLLLLSASVIRQRDAQSLAENPLDAAGMYRVLFVGTALFLALLALTGSHRATDIGARLTSRPFRMFCAYIGVVFIGAGLSINIPLTAYRGVELLTAALVVVGGYRLAGARAVPRILGLLYWWTAGSAIVVWLGTVLYPGEGIYRIDSPLPWQIKGINPVISSNGVGTIGAVLAIWSVALLVSKREDLSRTRWTAPIAVLGFVTLIFAQYRTGYVATALGLLILLGLRKRVTMAGVAVIAVVAATLWGAALLREAEPFALRGQTVDRAALLSSRLSWWSAAIPVWQESPIIGTGLLTGTRFLVLAEIGRTETSTIHGTWVEALVGTGVLGTACLLAFFVTTGARAFREALRGGRVVPALLVSILAVRSVTGPTFEAGGWFTVLVLILALSLRDGRQPARDAIEVVERTA
jgi:O-antigen ligase